MPDRISARFIGAVKDDWQLYSDRAQDYSIGAPIGFGASSIVYAAHYQPPNAAQPIPCALKVLDLDRLSPSALRLLQRETQLMSLSKHPNVLRVRGSWTDGHKLYIALRLMNAGSAADVMRFGWPAGMEEEVVKCILKQALEGINYLHINGLIHRDVKAANLLIDDDGTVLLGDLGVATFLNDPSDPSHKHHPLLIPTPTSPHNPPNPPRHAPTLGKRKSFVGTPCWMAPEVINGHTYDASADIWSFAITALELAQGRPPRSHQPSPSVLLHIVRDAPPSLDRTGAGGPHRYSRAFADVVSACLVKQPDRRPTAQELLNMPFFRSAKKKGYLVGTILDGLPPLVGRQERRKVGQGSLMTHATMDSWDFGTSPTTSVYSALARRPGVPAAQEGGEEGDEEDAAAYARRMRGRHAQHAHQHPVRPKSRPHSRSVSWSEDDYDADAHAHAHRPHAHAHIHPDPIEEVDLPPRASSPASESDCESDCECQSAPSRPSSPSPTDPPRPTQTRPMPTPHPSPSHLAPTAPSANTSSQPSSPASSVLTSSTPPSSTPPSSVSGREMGTGTGKLWKRLTGTGMGGEKAERVEKVKKMGLFGRTANVGSEFVKRVLQE